jgi:DNA polymerase-4
VTVKVRYADFSTVTRSHTASAPTSDAGEIAERALALLERTEAARRPVRLLGVGAHGLVGEDELVPVPDSLPF